MISKYFALFIGCLLWCCTPSFGAGGVEPASPFFAFCMDTHDAKKRSLQEQAEMIKELGFDGVGHLWLDQVPERLKTLDAAGLKLFQIYLRVNIASGTNASYDARLKQTLPLLKGRPTMLALLMVGGKPSDQAQDERAVALLREIADLAAPFGVKVALYHHAGDWLERVEDAVRIANKTERANVGVMFNLCHWLKVDEETNLQKVLRAARPHLLAVSLNGADHATEIRSGKGRMIQPLGRGDFDVLGFLQALRAENFHGPIGLQCYGLPGDAREHLAESIAKWREMNRELKSEVKH